MKTRSDARRGTEHTAKWSPLKWLLAVPLFLCISACFKGETQELSGPALLDSTGAMLKSNAPLRNVEKARIVVVIGRHNPELVGAPADTCGSPGLVLTADVVMGDGRRIVLSGHGASPCDAGLPPTTETIDLRREGMGNPPKDKIASVYLRSTKPVILPSIEWQTWEQGI